jgi:hypothetical protein
MNASFERNGKANSVVIRIRSVAFLSVALFCIIASLSIKAAYDLLHYIHLFPSWFVPSFAAGVAVLISYAGYITIQIWRAQYSTRLANGPLVLTIWILLPLSFICTSSVHQFYPFRPLHLKTYISIISMNSVFKINLIITFLGFAAMIALAIIYYFASKKIVLVVLLAFSFILLLPNDDCRNPFNYWWLSSIGASPLMFIPNAYAILFGVGTLLRVNMKLNTFAVMAICVSVTLLGLGHITRVIW